MFGLGIISYIKIGVAVALLAAGGGTYWYIGHLRADNALLTKQLAGYKRAVKILKEDLKTDRETQNEKDRIDSLTPEQLIDEFAKLRKRAGTAGNSNADEADD
jgi:hypothetical protein